MAKKQVIAGGKSALERAQKAAGYNTECIPRGQAGKRLKRELKRRKEEFEKKAAKLMQPARHVFPFQVIRS